MRLVHVRISHSFLLGMLTEGWHTEGVTCYQGLPEGARIIRSFTDDSIGCATLVVEHESFEEVPQWILPPVVEVWFKDAKQVQEESDDA